MRVLIPFSYYYPEQCAGIYIVDDLMHTAASEGISFLLTVPTPTRNVSQGVTWKRDEQLCDGSVRIHRFRMFGEGKNPVFRALRYLLCECVQLHYMLWKDYDIAFIDSTPPIQGLKLPIVRLLRKKPIIFNAQDLFPETLSGAGLARHGGLLWKIGMWVSHVTFRNSDKIIAISEDIRNGIVSRGIPAEKVKVIYNWVDEKAVRPVAKNQNPLFEEFGLDRTKFTVVYAGNLGNAQNIDIILDAARLLPSVQFVIFGTGGREQEIRSRVQEDSLLNVRLLPLQPVGRVSLVYSLGDVCVVSCKAGLGGSAMPSKTWSIMSCARPVLASFDAGELKQILESNRCGIFSRAGDVQEFVAAIRRLSESPALCESLGRNARRFIEENLTREVGTKKYVEEIKSFENQ